MKFKLLLTLVSFALFTISLNAQTENKKPEIEQITETLNDYIQGSTNGQPQRLKKAFHPALNLYYVGKEGAFKTWSGKAYIEDTKEGQPTGELGKIIFIDYENDIATAKVQITTPGKTPYIDYFMLMKIEGHWTIIHKMFTKRVDD